VPCPLDGSAGAADLTGLGGYSGYLNCPAFSDLCLSNGVLPAVIPFSKNMQETALATQIAYPAMAASCDLRLECAQTFANLMPACRALAFRVSQCFGTTCTGTMASFFNDQGITALCSESNRDNLAAMCQESYAGADELCLLAGATPLSGVASAMTIVVCLLFYFA
jgi:hypothetical protein